MTDTTAPLLAVVEGDAPIRESLHCLLSSAGFRVEAFESPLTFLDRRGLEPLACLVIDADLPRMAEAELQERVAERAGEAAVIFLTVQKSLPSCVLAFKAGAQEFMPKPPDPELLLKAVRTSVTRPQRLNSGAADGELIGQSSTFLDALRLVRLVADSNATVLLTGESGTGKELAARAIHQQSRRHAGPLVKVNCGAIPEALFESEFFGSMKGAFTGALRDRPGRFELADGGTLFLDEIGEVPLGLQAKLLRAVQEQEIERVGDVGTRKVDVRIIAATNRNLAAEIAAGRFREDLYYRLNVFPIHLPPLRERKEDIPALAEHFLTLAAARLGLASQRPGDDVLQQLTAYPWPGNIRELQNMIERAVLISRDGPLRVELPVSLPKRTEGSSAEPLLMTRDQLKQRERSNLLAALARTDGKVFGPNGAAALLGMKPTTLYSRIQALDLRVSSTDRYENSESGHELS